MLLGVIQVIQHHAEKGRMNTTNIIKVIILLRGAQVRSFKLSYELENL